MSQSCCFHVFSCPGSWHSLSHSLVPHMPQAGQAFGNAPEKSALPGHRLWDRTEGLGHSEETPDFPTLCELSGMGIKRLKAGIWLWSAAHSRDLWERRRKQSQQVNSPWVILKIQGKPHIISTNHGQQMCSGSKRERRCLNISVIQGWIVLPA